MAEVLGKIGYQADSTASSNTETHSIAITYRVKTDVSAGETGLDAKLAVAALPAPAGYQLKRLSAKTSTVNPKYHEVEAGYETPPEEEEDPLLRPADFSSSYDEGTEAYFKDADGTLVLNSAGDRFESFPERRRGSLILQVTKNFASFPAVSYDELKHTRNAAAVVIEGTTYAVNTLLMLPVTSVKQREKIDGSWVTYYRITFRLAADHGTHLDVVEDRGYSELVSADKVMILTSDGQLPRSAWPLDGSGVGQALSSDAPAEITFKPYDSVTWGIDFS